MSPDKTIKTNRDAKHAAAVRDGRHAKATAETVPYTLAPYTPNPERSHNVVVGGKIIGEIHEGCPGAPFHAVLDGCKVLGEAEGPLAGRGLIQGHGKTADEALRNAIKSGRVYADRYGFTVDEAARMLGLT